MQFSVFVINAISSFVIIQSVRSDVQLRLAILLGVPFAFAVILVLLHEGLECTWGQALKVALMHLLITALIIGTIAGAIIFALDLKV